MTLLAPIRPAFRAIATTIVPEAVALDDQAWDELERTVESALETRPAGMRRQLQLFVRVLNVLPLLSHGATLRRLDPARRARFLAAIESSRLAPLRKGFWGLRTLVYMGYYTRPAIHAEIGYRVHVRGWVHRRSLTAGRVIGPPSATTRMPGA